MVATNINFAEIERKLNKHQQQLVIRLVDINEAIKILNICKGSINAIMSITQSILIDIAQYQQTNLKEKPSSN